MEQIQTFQDPRTSQTGQKTISNHSLVFHPAKQIPVERRVFHKNQALAHHILNYWSKTSKIELNKDVFGMIMEYHQYPGD